MVRRLKNHSFLQTFECLDTTNVLQNQARNFFKLF